MATVGAAVEPQVFARRASGLVRVMSPASAFAYNVLTMGLIFPWTYLWGPFAAPGANIALGIVIAMGAQIFISLAYVWLAAAMPRSGGDYVFQSRIFNGPIGFVSVMSGFVIWILQWVALSGWLMAILALSPLFLSLGAHYENSSLLSVGTWFQTPWGVFWTSIGQAAIAFVLLISGFRNYVRLQRFLMLSTLVSFGVIVVLFLMTSTAEFQTKLNEYAAAVQGSRGFYDFLLNDVSSAGFNLAVGFTFLGTLLIAPIAWTSLQWATYSCEQGGEIKAANSVRQQMFIMVGATIFVGALLAILALVEQRTVGGNFLRAAGASYYGGVSASGDGTGVIAPFPNVLAMALTASPVLLVLIALGYMANSFQVTCNCYIGMTRVLVAMGLDRALPTWFAKVHGRLRSPVNAHLAYFVAAIPVIYGYNYWADWVSLTLGVTFACGYVFLLSVIAAALLPFRARDVYRAAPHREVLGIPLVTVLGGIGAACAAAMCASFLFVDDLGLTSGKAYAIVAGVIGVSALIYILMQAYNRTRGIDTRYAFQALPPE
jgi:basic amino acid/polyamine antiporter, APA family